MRTAATAGARLSLAAALAATVLGCGPAGNSQAPRREESGLFSDATRECGVEFQYVNGASGDHYLVETMPGGLAWIDADGDGHMDLYLTNGHERPEHAAELGTVGDRLFRNDGTGRFRDVTAACGIDERRYSNGAAVADYDNDGDSDLLVTNYGRNTLYRNRGGGLFDDVTESAGLAEEGYSASAVWFDLDRDGDLDLYVARYLEYDPRTAKPCFDRSVRVYCHPRFFPGESDLLYENVAGKFVDRSAAAGVRRQGPFDGKGLGVIAIDANNDGWTDLYVANDTTANILWRNNQNGTFTDVAFELGVAVSATGSPQASMGVDWGDVNGDGRWDIHVTNFSGELNNLFSAEEGGGFRDAAGAVGLGASFAALGFGTVLADFDLDGDVDIAVANGHVDDQIASRSTPALSGYKQRPDLYLNDGTGRFTVERAGAGAVFAEEHVGRALASSDFDNDGDVDLVMAALDRPALIARNNTRQVRETDASAPHYLRVQLVGTRSPRDGFGAVLEAHVAGRRQLFGYQNGRSYLSAVDPRVTIGLASARKVDLLRIRWPSGQTQELRDIDGDRTLVVEEPR